MQNRTRKSDKIRIGFIGTGNTQIIFFTLVNHDKKFRDKCTKYIFNFQNYADYNILSTYISDIQPFKII